MHFDIIAFWKTVVENCWKRKISRGVINNVGRLIIITLTAPYFLFTNLYGFFSGETGIFKEIENQVLTMNPAMNYWAKHKDWKKVVIKFIKKIVERLDNNRIKTTFLSKYTFFSINFNSVYGYSKFSILKITFYHILIIATILVVGHLPHIFQMHDYNIVISKWTIQQITVVIACYLGLFLLNLPRFIFYNYFYLFYQRRIDFLKENGWTFVSNEVQFDEKVAISKNFHMQIVEAIKKNNQAELKEVMDKEYFCNYCEYRIYKLKAIIEKIKSYYSIINQFTINIFLNKIEVKNVTKNVTKNTTIIIIAGLTMYFEKDLNLKMDFNILNLFVGSLCLAAGIYIVCLPITLFINKKEDSFKREIEWYKKRIEESKVLVQKRIEREKKEEEDYNAGYY